MLTRSVLLVSSLVLAASSLPDTISVVSATSSLLHDPSTIGALATRLERLLDDLNLIRAAQESERKSNDEFGSDPYSDPTPFHVTPQLSSGDREDNEVAELQALDEEKYLPIEAMTLGLAAYQGYCSNSYTEAMARALAVYGGYRFGMWVHRYCKNRKNKHNNE